MLAEMFNSLPVLPLAAILLLAGGVAMAWPLVAGAGGRSEVKRRLRVDGSQTPAVEENAAARAAPRRDVRDKALKKAQDFYQKTDPDNVARLRLKLVKAGFLDPRATGFFFLARIASLAVLAVLGAILSFGFGLTIATNEWLFVLLLGLTGYFLPGLALSLQVRQRMIDYRNGFPDFMDLMVVCSDAGMSMEAGIDRVSREMMKTCPALAMNLQLVTLELRAGRNLNDALRSLGDRLGLEEVRSFATLLQQSKELGTSLSGALRVFSDEMRHKRMLRAEEKAHALPAKMSVPVTMCILPVVLMVAMIPAIVQLVTMN
ncbi:MAG: type II secretion protein F [Phyllobacteriaceae bacterium]|nr:type II secretion protein F [Phyllobacteriaceae bacterium]MBA92910.1 type II secretion protein F [Phyllobacteriaceae bacterium]